MENLRADLHVHTYFSDGLCSPAEVVAEAIKSGVELLAVTDHDCMLAYPEAVKFCKAGGIKTVSGIEVSAYEDGVKVHTLGYNIEGEKPDFKAFLKRLYDGSVKRAEDIIYKLNKNGVNITFEEVVKKRSCPRAPIHSMYIARACAEKGYAGSAFTFYANYLSAGKCGYSAVNRPSPEEAVEVINSCGGLSVIAHPARIELSKDGLLSLVKKLKACGLGGIEGVYSTHTVTETAYYKEMAKAFNLAVTGGSDAHFKGGKKQIGTPLFYADDNLLHKLGI